MSIATDDWFTEICPEYASAFSVQINSKLHEETTPFQTIAIYDTKKFGKMMTIDGYIMLTSIDNFIYHEMMAHCCLLSHPNPKNVLIIGGGDCGTLKEVCKHPISSVIQVDIDEQVTRLSEKYFPELCTENSDQRATLLFEDAIEWIKNAKPHSLDVIIVDSTDPIGPGEGLFTKNFYQNCRKALHDNGVLIHQSESPIFQQDLLISMRTAIKGAGFANVETLFFPLPTYPSGYWSATIASNNIDLNSPRQCSTDLQKQLKYYTHDIHKGALCMPPFLTSI